MEWDVESLLDAFEVDYSSHGTRRKINGISSIKEATENKLSFCWYEGKKGISAISRSNAGVILCKKNMEGSIYPKPRMQLIFLDHPRLAFVQIASQMIPFYPLHLQSYKGD